MGKSYYTINTYDADVRIPEFSGLMQYGDGVNGNMTQAVEANNMETIAGVLQPLASPVTLNYSFDSRIETMAHLYRRWYSGVGDPDVLFAATAGKLYYLTTSGWVQLPFPTGVTAYTSNVWSCAAYEINPVGSTSSVDVLLMSNASDGMIMIRGDKLGAAAAEAGAVTAVNTQGKKFGVIERYAERIWGGAIDGDPDTLMYSAPYDPTDWEANTEIPEDGAGDINQPSWDGDSFTALRAFGSQLIAFKKTRVWRILGTDPGEYTFKEQYGGGAPYPNTIAVDSERILMVGRDGVQVYDGLAVNDYYKENIQRFWATVNKNALEQVCAVWHDDRYYVALPTGTSTYNNALIIYNSIDGTWLTFSGISIESFLPTQNCLYATSSTLPGKILQIRKDSWEVGSSAGGATRWVTPWIDLGYRKIQKGGFEVYFSPEVQSSEVTLKFSIQTEKKIKTKAYKVKPLTTSQANNNKGFKQKRLHFGGTGRRFRLIIETDAGVTAPWRLVGGVQILTEIDTD